MMRGRRRRVDEIRAEQFAVIGANIRALRLGKGWTQAKLGELMGWPTNSTVCAAEGRRNGRQRGFTRDEVERLATSSVSLKGSSPRTVRTATATLQRGSPA
jgi:transcriptional regulator with XRE-family HTH domain